MKITCYIRRTKLWAEEYKHSEEWLHKWKADKIANIWNNTFNISYTDFRKELNQIQQENIKEIFFDNVINQYEYKKNNSIIVPTDDDDWFNPQIISELKYYCKPVMFWNFVNYSEGCVTVQKPFFHKMKFIYESNNYSLINPQSEMIIKDHCCANDTLKNGFYIDSCLSLHNRTLASLGLLKDKLLKSNNPQRELLNLYETYHNTLEISNDVPDFFMKYIDKMFDIYRKKLKVCKLFF